MITSGTRLGPYEITAPLGAGGMGEVYRARDSRLDRTVAIKVLPAAFSSDSRLRERFEREAKAISALSHPHICTLFDVGSDDGTHYLVMEFLEGESLADRLAKGPLPLEQVIRYGVEIAEALEKAHRSGLVHRDLKPGNIMLTRSGAKLLDFGLVKFSHPQSDPNAATAAMTSAKPLTEEGAIVGTFQYMAPEQIEGRDADPRTDIFALGVLLYEMTTGKRAFEAKTRASLIASILDREPPPISTFQPLTPLALERVIRLCLAKDPDERWQSAHDVAAELKWIGASSSDTIGPGAHRRTRRAWLRNTALVLAGVLLGAAGTWVATRGERRAQPVTRSSIRASSGAPMLLVLGTLAISPDGRSLAYRATVGGKPQLFLRAADRLEAVPISGTENAHSPAFSPDGRWIAFVADNAVHKVPREGGPRIRLATSPGGSLGLSWAGDKIYSTRAFAGGIWEFSSDGSGEPRPVVKTDVSKNQRAVVWPDVLPGGKTVVATVWNAGAWDDARIVAFSIEDGTAKLLVQGGYFARYSPTGHLLFQRGGNLMAVPFDPDTLEIGSNPITVVNGVAHGTSDGEAHYAISDAGHLAYVSGGDSMPLATLWWLDLQGKQTPMVPTPRHYGSVFPTPDKRGAMVTLEGPSYDIWYLDFDRDSLTRISHGGDDADAVVTPDGNRVIWVSSRSGEYNLYWRAIDNSTPEELLISAPAYQELPAVTPDGRSLIYGELGKKLDLWTMELATKKRRPLIVTEFHETGAAVSPDGQWLAYTSDESGRNEVYVTSLANPAGKWQVSIAGGIAPKWTPDGRQLVYLNEPDLFLVPIELTPRVRPGKPRLLAKGRYDDEYAFASDGRLAVIKREESKTASEIHFVANFADELRRRVPTR